MGLWAVTHLTPAESESLFHELGGMKQGLSTLLHEKVKWWHGS